MNSNSSLDLEQIQQPEQGTSQTLAGIYTPLQAREIRLLHLEPTDDESTPLSGFFEVVELSNTSQPDFEALSYAWEGAFNNETLPDGRIELRESSTAVEIKSTTIAGNLNHALRRLRDNSTARVVWVDALCINQEDLSERSSQVQNMSSIYTDAKRVITWMGEESSDEDGKAVLYCIEQSLYGEPLKQESKEARAACLAAKQFWSRRYFSRRWIIQEYTLAKSLLIVCGPHSVEWNVACDFRIWARELPTALRGKEREHVLDPKSLKSKYWLHPDASSLDNVLVANHGLDCKDERDRIYALLSLMNHEYQVKVDYTLPWTDVYHQFMRTVIQKICPAFVAVNFTVIYRLLCVAASQAPPDLDGLVLELLIPSWVPNWMTSVAAHDAEGLDLYFHPLVFVDYHAGLFGEGYEEYLLLFIEEYTPISGRLEIGENIEPIYCPQYTVVDVDRVVGPRCAGVSNNLREYVNAVGGCLLLRPIPMLRNRYRLVGRCKLLTDTDGEALFTMKQNTFIIV